MKKQNEQKENKPKTSISITAQQINKDTHSERQRDREIERQADLSHDQDIGNNTVKVLESKHFSCSSEASLYFIQNQ
jgi:hypothetical protein